MSVVDNAETSRVAETLFFSFSFFFRIGDQIGHTVKPGVGRPALLPLKPHNKNEVEVLVTLSWMLL